MVKRKKLLSLALLGVVSFAVISLTPGVKAETSNITTRVANWSSLKNAVKNASKNEKIIIDQDIITDELDNRVVSDKKTITVDLNGHSIKKQEGTSYYKNGHIFEIQGNSNFTLIDSVGGGSLENGCAKNGGALNIHDGSKVTIKNVRFENNRASVDGGAIYNRGTLVMEDCYVMSNYSKDTGGGIYSGSDGTFDLLRVEVGYNECGNDGGGLNLHTDKTSKIRDSYIHDNLAKDEGGGFRYDEDDETLELHNTTIENNRANDCGGGFFLEEGNIHVYGCKIIRNKADKHGGGIFSEDNLLFKESEKTNSVEYNTASKEGGGIFSKDTTEIKYCSINNNTSEKDGAGIYIESGETKINDSNIRYNRSNVGNGGGIYVYDATLRLRENVVISGNYSSYNGGGIFCHPEMDKLYVQKNPIVKDNKAGKGNNILFYKGDKISLDGQLVDDAYLAFTLHGCHEYYEEDGDVEKVKDPLPNDVSGRVTENYNKYNKSDAIDKFFHSDGFKLKKDDGEIYTTGDRKREEVVVNDVTQPNSFIPWNEQVNTDYDSLTGANWLSGISGERKINEINTPVTHDSSMKKTASATSCAGSFFGYWDYAITQYGYIYEQLVDGVRGLDLRLSNKRVWKKGNSSGDQKDDGENLYMCHGKTSGGGTFYAADPDTGYPLNFLTVLGWIEDFLTNHPTEYVILDFGAECQHDYDKPKVFQRLDKILRERVSDINQSTGESFFYLQDGEYGKDYEDWPLLKDVRGKIVLQCGTKYDIHIGGIPSKSFGGRYYTPETKGSYKDSPGDRLDNIKDFAKKEIATRDLPTDASRLIDEKTGKEIFMKTGTNCTNAGIADIPDSSPLNNSLYVDDFVYRSNKIIGPINTGKFLGWFSSDGITSLECSLLYRTNFFDGLEYYNVIVRSNKAGIPDQTFKLLKGSEFTIPGYIYDYEQNDTNGYFKGWSIDGAIKLEGSKYIVPDSDVIVDAVWSDSKVEFTKVKIIWKDANNLDGLREDVQIKIKGTDRTLTNDDKWAISLPYEIESSDIELTWNKATGVDGENTYKYEIIGNNKIGYYIILTHTPDTLINITSKVTFVDVDDSSRPADITYGIYEYNSDVPVDQKTFTYDDNTKTFENLPKYKNGLEIIYVIKYISSTNNLAGTANLDNYDCHIDKFDVEYEIKNLVDVNVNIYWTDIVKENRIENLNIKLKNKDSNVEVLSYIHDNLFGNDSTEEDDAKVDESISEYSFRLIGEKLNENEDAVINFDEYELIIVDEVAGIYFNIFINDDGYYVIASHNQYETDYGMVIGLINSIGEVTLDSRLAIMNSRFTYGLLSEANKAKVTNYEILVSAEAAYLSLLNEDVIRVIDLINQIGAVEDSSESKEKIDSARNAYNALNHQDKANVINYDMLVKAETAYDNLTKKETRIRAIVEKVIEAINEIGEVDYYSDYSSSNIDDARSAYNLLPQDKVNDVSNYDVLVQAEADYFAQSFTASIKDIYTDEQKCDGHEEELSSKWIELRESWDKLVAETKALLKSNDTSESIEEFNHQYTSIISRYTDLTLFSGGPEASAELKSIVVSGTYKTEYNLGEELNTTGLVVTASYYDNTTKVVTNYTISGYDKNTTGDQVITVSYTENNVSKTTTFNVKVLEKKEEKKEDNNEEKSNTGMIIGIVAGSIAIVLAVGIGVVIFIKKRH